jgi:hypothetical protein
VVRLDFVAGCSDSNIFPPSWGGSGRIDTIRLLRPSPAVRKLMVETGLFRGEREAVGAAEEGACPRWSRSFGTPIYASTAN